MTKIVYNACYGGFGLSNEAIVRYAEIKGLGPVAKRKRIERNDPALVQVVEELGDKAIDPAYHWNGGCAELRIIDIPAGTLDRIERNDPALVQVVEELGDKANGGCAELRIIDIPAGTLYRIDEYDGAESVMTQDDYDWKVA